MSTRRKRIVSAALLLPAVLFSIVWTSYALWRCPRDGLARTECCCPKDSGAKPAGEAAAATIAAACCELERHEVDRVPAEAARSGATHLLAALAQMAAALPVNMVIPPEPRVLQLPSFWLALDGPPRGRLILAQKQSLLI